MFEARHSSATLIRKVLEAVKELLNEASWDCTENGMSLQAMDTSHVTLVSVKLDAQGFEEYRCDRTLNLGINLGSMTKILKCAGAEDTITIRTQEEADSISFLFDSPNSERSSEFEIKLMDLDQEHLGIPETDYSVTVSLAASEFQRICRDMAQIGDTLTLAAAKGGIAFSAKGDLGNGSVRLSSHANADDEDNAVLIDVQEPVTASFAIKYLNMFTKATSLSSRVTLSMSNDVPLVVEYKIEDMGYIRYYLAPKIEEEADKTQ